MLTEREINRLVAANLRYLRRTADISFAGLGHMVYANEPGNPPANWVAEVERSRRRLTIFELARLAQIFDVPPDHFYTNIPPDPRYVRADICKGATH